MSETNGTLVETKPLKKFASGSYFTLFNQTILNLFGWSKGDMIEIKYDKNTEEITIRKQKPSSCSSERGAGQ